MEINELVTKLTDSFLVKDESGTYSCPSCERKSFKSPQAVRCHYARKHTKTMTNHKIEKLSSSVTLDIRKKEKHINFCPVCGTNVLLLRTVLNS